MRTLVIEYLFEGHKRGYNFTSPTQGFNDDTLKYVWRNAMPRGQGWGAALYIGAKSLKSWEMPDGRIALSETNVTGLRDESGRGGIRRSVIQVMQSGEYQEEIKNRLDLYKEQIQLEIRRKLRFGERRKIPKIKGDRQVIVSCPYTNSEDWELVEALILQSVYAEMGKTWFQSKFISFTTLALDYHEESMLVVLPESRADELGVDYHPIQRRK